jgi:hypothetical protein
MSEIPNIPPSTSPPRTAARKIQPVTTVSQLGQVEEGINTDNANSPAAFQRAAISILGRPNIGAAARTTPIFGRGSHTAFIQGQHAQHQRLWRPFPSAARRRRHRSSIWRHLSSPRPSLDWFLQVGSVSGKCPNCQACHLHKKKNHLSLHWLPRVHWQNSIFKFGTIPLSYQQFTLRLRLSKNQRKVPGFLSPTRVSARLRVHSTKHQQRPLRFQHPVKY